MPSKFLTMTFFVYMRFAVRVRHTVTVASKPSGTFATIIPIMKTREVTASWPMPRAAAKNDIPRAKAMAEMIWMKWWISLLIGVCSASVDKASWAILPMTCVARTLSISIPRRGDSHVMMTTASRRPLALSLSAAPRRRCPKRPQNQKRNHSHGSEMDTSRVDGVKGPRDAAMRCSSR